MALIIWLINPGTRGAEVLYNKYIWKLLKEYASKWDPTFKSNNAVWSKIICLPSPHDRMLAGIFAVICLCTYGTIAAVLSVI